MLRHASVHEDETVEARPLMAEHPLSPSPLSILVVEDDAALRSLFEVLLTRNGFRVECVEDGAIAIDRLAQKQYAVILLDLMMPETNGFDILRHLAESRQKSVIERTIIITGVSELELARTEHVNVFAVLRKPFDIDSLVATVRDCVRQMKRAPEREQAGSETEDGDTRLDLSARRLESALPSLDELLSSGGRSDRELMLRDELRRSVVSAAGILAAAAQDRSGFRAARLVQIAKRATMIATLRGSRSKQGH